MNNKNFILELSRKTGYTVEDTQKMTTTLVDVMSDCFQKGESVSIPKFGTFEVKKRMERIVVNPAIKQRMLVPPKLVLTFKPFAAVRKRLKNGGNTNG